MAEKKRTPSRKYSNSEAGMGPWTGNLGPHGHGGALKALLGPISRKRRRTTAKEVLTALTATVASED